MPKERKIMIVAGEPSGDAHAAKLVRALRSAEPLSEFEFFGAAGAAMRDAGVDPVVVSDDLSIVGLAEIGRALPVFLSAMKVLKEAAVGRKPEAAILVDFPDFNLKLAKALKKRGVKVIYFISPQLWAWRKYRIATIRKYVDLLITILPFEAEWYSKRGVTHVEYVGNPLANEVHASRTREQFCGDHGLDPARSIVSLLPGSRRKEILRILPIMLSASAKIASKLPDIQFIVPLVSGRHRADVESMKTKSMKDGQHSIELTIVENETYDALNASDAAAVASGTATLETGIIGTPMAVVYRTSAINYALLEPMISVDHFGLINLIAGERVANEFIQKAFTPATLADEMIRILELETNSLIRKKLKEAVSKLGTGGASIRAAAAILRTIDQLESDPPV